ncbi:MAG: phage terminase large subunit [Melioribacteraceae bacterium]
MEKNELIIPLEFHDKQQEIFYDSDARYKVIAKGRRFGLTKGFANYVIANMLNDVSPILWVDTIYGNIERYVERYFIPELKQLPKDSWRWRSVKNDLKIMDSVCDFKSADRPENLEGFGYKLIILNEAGIILKNRRLWEESIAPMTLDYKAKVLIGGTPKGKKLKRNHEEHLFYELYKRGETNEPPFNSPLSKKGEINMWKSFNYSSYDNPMLDADEIDQLAKEIPLQLRNQEIYGEFIDSQEQGIVNPEWWKYYSYEELNTKRVIRKIQSWDTAFKTDELNCFSVCTTWTVTNDGYYLISIWRDRLEFPDLKRKVVELYEKFRVDEVLIEDKASGQSLIQELNRETRIPIKAIKVDRDKLARLNSCSTLIESGKVFLPSTEPPLSPFDKGGNIKELIDELSEFPNSEFDDIVDSVTQFLNYAKTLTTEFEKLIHITRKTIKTKYGKYRR